MRFVPPGFSAGQIGFLSLKRTVDTSVQYRTVYPVAKPARTGAEEARKQLPALLEAAERGRSTIITKHGRPVAALIPLEEFETTSGQQSLVSLRGSGNGLWGEDSVQTIRDLRDEWNR